MENNLRVLVADDHRMISDGLARALKPFGIDATEAVADGERVAGAFLAKKPDVLILDLRLGQVRGFDIASRIMIDDPSARIVFFSQYDQDSIIRQAYKIGGKAFVPKSAEPKVLAEAVKSAHAGSRYFLPEIAQRIAAMNASDGNESPLQRLSKVELSVFRSFAAGHGLPEVARDLCLSPTTVLMVKNAVKAQLGVRSSSQFASIAKKHAFAES